MTFHDYASFIVFARDTIKKLKYERKHEIDAYFGAWLMDTKKYTPGSRGQKQCHKTLDWLWEEYQKEAR